MEKVMLQGEGLMNEFIRSEKQIRRKQAVRTMICMALLILLSAVL